MNKFRIVGNELLKHKRNIFSLNQIVKATGLERSAVRDILLDFWRGKYIIRIRKDVIHTWKKYHPFENPRYQVVSPKKMAARIAAKYRGENNAADRIWFIIRKKVTFTRRDLRVLAGATSSNVRWVTKRLAKARIIAARGRSGEWFLLKDVGPQRPYVGDES